MELRQFKPIIKELVLHLAKEEYEQIKINNQNKVVNIEDLERVIKEYGCIIIPLPDKAFSLAQIYNIKSENRLDVYIPLWTQEEGRSDLTISLSCFYDNESPKVEINDLKVL